MYTKDQIKALIEYHASLVELHLYNGQITKDEIIQIFAEHIKKSLAAPINIRELVPFNM